MIGSIAGCVVNANTEAAFSPEPMESEPVFSDPEPEPAMPTPAEEVAATKVRMPPPRARHRV